jgi:hypothetical protein
MRGDNAFVKQVVICGALLLFEVSTAFADSLTVRIQNDDTQDVYVSVYDQNTMNHNPVLSGERINEGQYKDISITADGNSRGSISWAATRADPNNPGCGSGDKSGLANNDLVSISAQGTCTDALKRKALGKKSAEMFHKFSFHNLTSIPVTVTLKAGTHADIEKKVGPDKEITFDPAISAVGSVTISVDDGSHDKTTQTLTVSGQKLPLYIATVDAKYNVGSITGEVTSNY